MFVRHFLRVFFSSIEAKNTLYLFLLQGVDKVFPLFVVPYLMITLGAENYGYVGFAFAVIQYLSMLVDFGFNLSATKRIAIAREQGNHELNRIFSATFYAKCLLLFVGTILVVIFSITIPSFQQYSRTILYTYPLVVGTTLTMSWLYQGMGEIRTVAIVTSLCRMLVLPLTFIFIRKTVDYNMAALIQSSVYLLAGFIAIILIFKKRMVSLVSVSLSDIKAELRESCPLFLSSVATSIYTQLFTLILGLTATPVVVGRYVAAERIMRSLCFAIYSPISISFYPKIAMLGYSDINKAQSILKKLVLVIFFSMFCLSVVLFLFAVPISDFLGKDYSDLALLMRIMSIAPVFIALGAIYGQFGLVAMGNSNTKKQFLGIYMVAGFFSLFMVCVLTFLFVDIGAAIAMVLTELFVFVAMCFYYHKNQKCLHL